MLSPAERWERVAELLEKSTQLPLAERASFIHAGCGGDLALRDELLSLLRFHELAGGPLDAEPVLPADYPDAGDARGAGDVPEAGSEVGAYRLLRPIGEGGMGSVWLAERSDGILKRMVALKRPHISWSGALAERMAQERDILAGLEHPNIARLYDAGVDAQGRPYLALEYVEGDPITEYCDRVGMSVAGRLRLFLQVLDAVRFAHAHLVIHRDIKPSNILVSAEGRVHLLDFGIAKLLRPDRPNDLRTQWAGEITPNYASPEQISGSIVSTASDVYSLGVLLAELLCGSRPYELKRASRGALEEAILEAQPRAPSRGASPQAAQTRATSLNALKRALSGDLDGIVLKALQKKPEHRYATADLLGQDIARHLRGEPILAHRGSAWYYTVKFFGRHRRAAGFAAVAVAALLASTGVALWQAHAARLEAARAEQVKSFALSILDSADSDEGAGAATTAVDLLHAARQRVELELAGRPAIAAELMTAIGFGLIGQGRSEEAADLLRQAVKLSAQANGSDDARTLAAQAVLGEALFTLGKDDEAIALLEPTATSAHRLHESHTEIDALRFLSSAQIDKGDIDAAIGSARAAVAALDPAPVRSRRALIDAMQAHLGLANILNSARRPGVVAEARIAQELAARMPDVSTKSTSIDARVLISQGLVREGQVADGLKELETAYADKRAFLGDDHPQTEIVAHFVGNVRLEAGEVQAAIAAYQAEFDSVTRHQAQRGAAALAYANLGLAAALAAAREREQALSHAEAAARLFTQSEGPGAPLTTRALIERARMLTELGRLNEAERAFATLEPRHFAVAEQAAYDGALAQLRSLQGRHEEAAERAQSSADYLRTAPSRTAQAQSQARLGEVLLRAGRTDEAIAALDRSTSLYRQAQVRESPDYLQASALLAGARAAPRSLTDPR
jgi:hypothetical protein